MKKVLLCAIILMISNIFLVAQNNFIPNIVCSQKFTEPNDIYSTFTQGIVHYEAPVMYIYGELYGTETMPDSPDHSIPEFRNSYLYPIYSQYKKNNGKVHPEYEDEMYVFIRIQYDAKKTYQKLITQVTPYKEMLTYRVGSQWFDGRVKLVFVGDISNESLKRERMSYASRQGTLEELDSDVDPRIMPVIGIDFEHDIEWDGVSTISFDEFVKIKGWVSKAHASNRKVRLYNCPEDASIWDKMVTAGVDLITTNEVEEFKYYLSSK